MEAKFDLQALAGGAINERVNAAVEQIYENILDPNTEDGKARKLTIEMTFKPSKNAREMLDIGVVCKTTLAPRKTVDSVMMLGRDSNGKIVGREYGKNVMPGQMDIEENVEELKNEAGIIEFQKPKAN